MGTLADLPGKVAEAKLAPPAITIVGEVVSLRGTMNWFETRPLFGQTIVVTRTRQQASDLSRRLGDLGRGGDRGADDRTGPARRTGPPVDAALRSACTVTTGSSSPAPTASRSPSGGCWTWAWTPAPSGGRRSPPIGDATAAAVRDELCLNVDVCPERFVAEALADELIGGGEVGGKRFLLLRADIARPVLREKLRAARGGGGRRGGLRDQADRRAAAGRAGGAGGGAGRRGSRSPAAAPRETSRPCWATTTAKN